MHDTNDLDQYQDESSLDIDKPSFDEYVDIKLDSDDDQSWSYIDHH